MLTSLSRLVRTSSIAPLRAFLPMTTAASENYCTMNSAAQSGILPEGDNTAFFSTYKMNYELLSTKEGFANFTESVKKFPQVLKESSEVNKMPVTGTISFGKKLWETLTENNKELKGTGAELFDFPGYGKAPATQADFYVHIHSKYNGACYDCASMFMGLLMPNLLTVADSVNGFVWRDSRDLTGFIDGTENPSGQKDRAAAALNEDQCSFALVQRFEHNLSKWGKLTRDAQESVIGRTKPDSTQLKPLPMGSHVAHTDIDVDGVNVKMVRQSLPYGSPNGVKGLWFTCYCHYLKGIDETEKSIFGLRGVEEDHLMSYITPVTGGYYFAPSLTMLSKL